MVWIDKVVEFFGGNQQLAALAVAVLLSTVLSSVCCCILLLSLYSIRRRLRERKARRAEIKRRLEFTLPDKENGYVRDRLHTALNTAELGGLREELFGADRKSVGVRLGYARKMLAKIKEAPLSPIERLDVEEMARLVALFGKREKWSGADIKGINEIFARLLKLSAKYEIAV